MGQERRSAQRRSPNYDLYVLCITGFIGIALTLSFYFIVQASEDWGLEKQFISQADRRIEAISRVLKQDNNVLHSLRTFFNASAKVDRHEFTTFASRFLDTNEEVLSLNWIPLTPHQMRDQIEYKARRDGFKGFCITQLSKDNQIIRAQDKEIYYPVFYAVPDHEENRLFGYDLGSVQKYSDLLNGVWKSGKITVSPPIDRVMDADRNSVFVTFLPVYDETSNDRSQHNLKGFLMGVYDTRILINKVLENLDPMGIDIHVLFAEKGHGLKGISFSDTFQTSIDNHFFMNPIPSHDLMLQSVASVTGREWYLICRPTPYFISSNTTWIPLSILIAGLVTTGLLILLLRGQLSRTRAIQKIVAQRTAELVKANEQLQATVKKVNQLAEEAELANLAKGQFLANMSHEIRTPLNGIVSMSRLLMQSRLEEEQRCYAETVGTCSDALLSLINDILDFSKIDAGKLEMESLDFDLQQVADQTIDILSEQAREKNLDFSFMIEPDTPKLLVGDPGRLRQVLINLSNNAIKFTHRGEVSIKASLVKEIQSQATLRFDVKDTGIGIPDKELDQLFTSFTQVDPSTTRKYGGTGLGLAIAKQIIELMGGHINVTSKVDEGTNFFFTCILRKQETHKQEQKVNSIQTANLSTLSIMRRQQIRILIVEDNVVNQKVTSKILEKLGYGAHIVVNGLEAVKILEKQHFDLVLMDCQMPVMDGYKATLAIRSPESQVLNPKIPIMAMTANAMKGDRDKCLACGMNDYLTKPVQPKELALAIERNLASVGMISVNDLQ